MLEPMHLLAMTRDSADERKKTVRKVRELTIAERELLSTSSQHLNEFESWDLLMRMVRDNHADFGAAVNDCRTSANAAYKRGRFRPLFDLTVNRALINFLATFGLYLGHTETRFKHRFGDPSVEVDAFRTAASVAFDRSFAYRFVYNLRNYTLHCGMPVVHTTFRFAARHDGPDYEISFHFDSDHLLASGPSYWKQRQVKLDLESRRSTPFEVEPLLTEAADELSHINQQVIAVELPHLHQAASAIMNMLSEVTSPESVPALGEYRPNADGMKVRFYDIPWVMLESLGYVSLPNE